MFVGKSLGEMKIKGKPWCLEERKGENTYKTSVGFLYIRKLIGEFRRWYFSNMQYRVITYN